MIRRPYFDLLISKKTITIQLFSTTLLLFLFLLPLQAATYKIGIDFHHPSLKFTGTRNAVTITFLDESGGMAHQETARGILAMKEKLKTFEYTTQRSLKAVVIKMEGNDAFYLDRLLVWKDGELIQEHGEEGGKGWCMSADDADTNGPWKNFLEDDCRAARAFTIEEKINTINALGPQTVSDNLPSRRPTSSESSWVYHDNESRNEINAEGLGRCYDIRYVDPINWSNETLRFGQRASVIALIRDDSRRPARHNDKDYVVPKGVVFTSEIIGDSEAQSKFAATSYEYETEVLEEYRADISQKKVGSAKMSAAFKDVNNVKGKNTSLYAFSKMYKQYYKLDLYFDDPSHQHYIDPRFWNGVKELGHDITASEFINKFGTHYASTTYYGGNFFQRRTVSQSEYSYYESSESEFKIDIEGTIKKVNFDVGTTQNIRNDQGETEQVKMSSANIYTVGGDLNQYRPDLWAASVLQNLAVVKVSLTRISDLLTAENFPDIPNINEKRQLLEAAIMMAEQEASFDFSQPIEHSFFTKKPATYTLTVTHMKCMGHGSKEPGENSEYFGSLTMGFFNKDGTALKTSNFFNRSAENHISLGKNESYDLNKSLSLTLSAADIANGYISVYGNLKEDDTLSDVKLSSVSKHESKAKIYYRMALDNEVKKSITFTSKYGDKVTVYFTLKKN